MIIGLALLVGLYVAQTQSYLLFHSIVEVFSVAVAVALLMLAWNSRHFIDSHFLVWIGIGYGFVAMIDLVHTLSYRGMGVLGDLGTDPPTQLWIAARFIQAVTLLTAPLFFDRKLRARLAATGFATVTALVMLSIFAWDIFPTAWSEAAGGLTTFKIISEYVICGMLLAATVWFLIRRDRLDPEVLALLVGSIVATLVAELSFTLYADPYGLPNLLGHYLKLVAFYLIYKAVVETGLRRPYKVLFRDLRQREQQLEQSQQELESLNETLEERVIERTRQARALARELAQAEARERARIAQILHDDLQQTLAASRMRVQMAASSPDSSGEALEVADEQISQAIEIARCLAVEVSPAVVRDRGLGPALHWLGDHMHQQHGLTVHVTASQDIHLGDPDVGAMIFRIVRELLFNVVKHAGIDEASLFAEVNDDGELCVTVSDEGNGFDTDEVLGGDDEGFGLDSVRNRVEMLGGRCVISSAPGEGTQIALTVPSSRT